MLNTNQIVEDWCNNHGVKIIDTNKKAYRHLPINISYFADPTDFNFVVENRDIRFETQPLYTVEIAKSELEKVSEFEHQVFNNMRVQGHYRMFEIIMEQKEKEKFLRENYPAVKKAYEQYSLMLKLAESGEL